MILQNIKDIFKRINFWSLLGWGYMLAFYAWVMAYFFYEDPPGIFHFVTDLGLYIFLLAFLVLAGSIRSRKKWLLGSCMPAVLLFSYLWGGLFLPKQTAEPGLDAIRVMTININGWRSDHENLLAVIKSESPDVIFFQELGTPVAKKIAKGLKKAFPFQIMEPKAGISGMGVASRYPVTPREPGIRSDWIGIPQTINLDWDGREIVLVNVHMKHTPVDGRPDDFDMNFSLRQKEADELLAYLEELSQPVIVAGDFNTTSLSTVYRNINAVLEDAWTVSGYGFGHSFPSSKKSALYFVKKARIVPPWLVRIDYIFYSPEFTAAAAKMALYDGISDHRGVVSDLVFTLEGE